MQYVDTQLALYRDGNPDPVFDALADILARNVPDLDDKTVLEVGCSSGYYSEVFRIKGISCPYRGCDYSEVFIEKARSRYPELQWDIEDATSLSYQDAVFDVVISGNCILHIYNFEAAIAEAARVSRSFVVFSRTPVVHNKGPVYYRKHAYGVEMLEIHFHEEALIELMAAYGLELIDVETIDVFPFWKDKDTFAIKTYLCEKRRNSRREIKTRTSITK